MMICLIKCLADDQFINDHRLISANDQALGYVVELSIINQNYVQIYHICYCFASTKI